MKYIALLVRAFRNALLSPPDGRLFQRALLNYVLAISGSLALVGIAAGVLTLLGIPLEELSAPDMKINLRDFLGAVVIAPVFETLLLAGMLALMPLRWGIARRAIISAIVWGLLHGVFAPLWFFGSVFGFFVFSCGYMVWRQKSFAYGFAAASIPHAIINLTVFVITAISE